MKKSTDETVQRTRGRDTGGKGQDYLIGGTGKDLIQGALGDDIILGGDDYLDGGASNGEYFKQVA